MASPCFSRPGLSRPLPQRRAGRSFRGPLETQLPKSLDGRHLAHLFTSVDLDLWTALTLTAKGQKAGGEGRGAQQAHKQGANGSSRLEGGNCKDMQMQFSCRLRLPTPVSPEPFIPVEVPVLPGLSWPGRDTRKTEDLKHSATVFHAPASGGRGGQFSVVREPEFLREGPTWLLGGAPSVSRLHDTGPNKRGER